MNTSFFSSSLSGISSTALYVVSWFLFETRLVLEVLWYMPGDNDTIKQNLDSLIYNCYHYDCEFLQLLN